MRYMCPIPLHHIENFILVHVHSIVTILTDKATCGGTWLSICTVHLDGTILLQLDWLIVENIGYSVVHGKGTHKITTYRLFRASVYHRQKYSRASL